jgi:hypothetical protein
MKLTVVAAAVTTGAAFAAATAKIATQTNSGLLSLLDPAPAATAAADAKKDAKDNNNKPAKGGKGNKRRRA